MTGLSDAALHDLAGGDVATIAAAQDVPVTTAADVETARQAAERAEQAAARSEKAAIAGTGGHAQAVSDREAAKFARWRVALAERKAERHAQAERIRGLDAVGQQAVKHAAALKGLRDRVVERQAKIAELHAANASDIAGWNGQLNDLIGQAVPLEPEKPRPGMVPSAGSAHVYAGASPPVFVVRNQVLTPVREDHPDGPLAAIEAAHRETRQHDPAVRLIRGENGIVIPLGRDAGGHLERRIREGTIHELTLAEKHDYYSGGAA